jgi:hypothetical protein
MKSLPQFLSEKIGEKTPSDANPLATILVKIALNDRKSGVPLSERLAASFDLLVASKFYQYVVPEGWLWCGHSNKDFYPFLNACPSCVLDSRFVHHEGHKPGSGQIGPTTALAFREIVASYFSLTGKKNCIVCNASEPIDLAILDTKKKIIFMAEVKAAPLFTPPLCRPHTANSMQTQKTLPLNHSLGVERRLHEAEFSLYIPDSEKPLEIPIEAGAVGKEAPLDKYLAQSFKKNPALAVRYFKIWRRMWIAYQEKRTNDILYWFCGACGLPRNPGEGWPRQSDGKPKGSISDGKTSVGLDRTDDIKKATFQALKLGVENRGRDAGGWTLLIGLASNLHASRHYTGYLKPYEDIIWGWGKQKNARELYNLFDGIISLTKSHIRHDWLSHTLDWEGDNHE